MEPRLRFRLDNLVADIDSLTKIQPGNDWAATIVTVKRDGLRALVADIATMMYRAGYVGWATDLQVFWHRYYSRAQLAAILPDKDRPSPNVIQSCLAQLRTFAHGVLKSLDATRDCSGPQAEPPAETQAVWLGKGRVRVGDELIAMEGATAEVVEALVKRRAATTAELIRVSGYDQAVTYIRRLRKSHPQLAPFFPLPGRKNAGGYRTTLVDGTAV